MKIQLANFILRSHFMPDFWPFWGTSKSHLVVQVTRKDNFIPKIAKPSPFSCSDCAFRWQIWLLWWKPAPGARMSSSLRFEKEGVRLDWLRKTFVTARRRLQNESAPGRRRSSWNSPKKTKALDPSYANLIGKKRKCKRYSSRGQVNDYPAAFLPGCLFAGVLGGQKGQKIGSFSGAEVQTERKRWKVLKMKKGCGKKKKHFESSENCWHSILSGFFFQGNVYLTCCACCHRYLSCLFPKLPNQFGWLVVAAYFLFPKSLQSTHLSSTRPPKSWMVSSKLPRFILLI